MRTKIRCSKFTDLTPDKPTWPIWCPSRIPASWNNRWQIHRRTWESEGRSASRDNPWDDSWGESRSLSPWKERSSGNGRWTDQRVSWERDKGKEPWGREAREEKRRKTKRNRYRITLFPRKRLCVLHRSFEELKFDWLQLCFTFLKVSVLHNFSETTFSFLFRFNWTKL